ncbi:unnamed protein product [Pelagomonas calceolata]|uniref:Uncharacterized protein n=1 Tax=Pelagomonas calceolata TaxID=35677 RepID=A0A7S4A6T0_9STRA|nr:unnamed protein product [Pelagomonas calceolata]|mmetsp:Transcript_6698/g.18819  ORF Transcript_6698/g.18819 Transcript_6698/m.18819 type:complete len:429 (-) Transcript_6698:638-1924(-)
MADVDARPWHEAKGLELGNWLRNKCPQRQFGGQAKVDGLVRTLTAAHERLEKAETDEERCLAWAHVALDLEASCKRAGDFHQLWVANLLQGTPSEPTTEADKEAQTETKETTETEAQCEIIEPAPTPKSTSTVLPPLDLAAASAVSVEPLLSKTERPKTPKIDPPGSQSARASTPSPEEKPNLLKMSMLERQEYVRKQKQAKLEKARQAKADAEVAEMRAPRLNKPRRVNAAPVVALAAERLKKPLKVRDENKAKAAPKPVAEKKKAPPKKKKVAAAKPEPPKKEDKDEQFMTRLAALRHDAQAKIAQQAAEEAEAKIAQQAAEQAAAAVDPAEAARALIRTEVEFDRKVDGRYFYRLRHADDIEAKSIYRRRAGNGEGVALSVGRDAKNAEHVLQVLFDEDLWNATTAHDYLVQHYSVEYSRRLESN